MLKFRVNKQDQRRVVAALLKASDRFIKRVRVQLKDGLWDMAFYAGKNHEYTTRSGNLDRAYVVVVTSPSGLSAELLLDKKVSGAPYAWRIHEGWGTWQPDQFVYQARDALLPEFEKNMETAIRMAIKEAGF